MISLTLFFFCRDIFPLIPFVCCILYRCICATCIHYLQILHSIWLIYKACCPDVVSAFQNPVSLTYIYVYVVHNAYSCSCTGCAVRACVCVLFAVGVADAKLWIPCICKSLSKSYKYSLWAAVLNAFGGNWFEWNWVGVSKSRREFKNLFNFI